MALEYWIIMATLATMAKWSIGHIFAGSVCSGHKIACGKWKKNAWLTLNGDILVNHLWKSLANRLTRDQKIIIHGKPYIVLYIINLRFTPQPSGPEGYCRHGPGGRAGGWAGGCQTCGTHISVTAWRIFSIRGSVELSRPLVVHCHGHLPICPIWACPWAKNLSNLAQIGSRLCGTQISETAGWIYPI